MCMCGWVGWGGGGVRNPLPTIPILLFVRPSVDCYVTVLKLLIFSNF